MISAVLVIVSRGTRNAVNTLVLVTKPECAAEMKEGSNVVMMLNPAVDDSAVIPAKENASIRMNAAQRPMSVEMRIQHNAVNLDLNVVLMLHDRSVLLLQRSVVVVLVSLVIRKKEKPVVENPAVRVQRDVKQVNVCVRRHFVGQDLLLNVV